MIRTFLRKSLGLLLIVLGSPGALSIVAGLMLHERRSQLGEIFLAMVFCVGAPFLPILRAGADLFETRESDYT